MHPTHANILNLIKESGVATDVSNLNSDTDFNDYGIDSLDVFNILMAVEEKYGIKIPDDEVENLNTVQAIINFIKTA